MSSSNNIPHPSINHQHHHSCASSPPPWGVLLLVADHLDPKSLAASSCVSKLWSICFSSDNLWQPICATQFPSLSTLRNATTTPPTISYRRLYSLGHTAAKRHLRKPLKPLLSLDDLLFTIDVRTARKSGNQNNIEMTIVKPCDELKLDQHGLFRFDIDMESCRCSTNNQEAEDGVVHRHGSIKDYYWDVELEELNGVKVTWNVILKGWKGVFTMLKSVGNGKFVAAGVDGYFSEELPSPSCCSGTVPSGLVADLRLGFRMVDHEGGDSGGGNGKKKKKKVVVVVDKVSLAVLSILSWRYVSVADTLCYLQHFLCVD